MEVGAAGEEEGNGGQIAYLGTRKHHLGSHCPLDAKVTWREGQGTACS